MLHDPLRSTMDVVLELIEEGRGDEKEKSRSW